VGAGKSSIAPIFSSVSLDSELSPSFLGISVLRKELFFETWVSRKPRDSRNPSSQIRKKSRKSPAIDAEGRGEISHYPAEENDKTGSTVEF
jgi:hypothetical protein